VQKHADAGNRPEAARSRCPYQRGFEWNIDYIADHGIRRQRPEIDGERRLALHAERSRIDEKIGADKRAGEIGEIHNFDRPAKLQSKLRRSLFGTIDQKYALRAAQFKRVNNRPGGSSSANNHGLPGINVPSGRILI
jgi:hypothetical protein